MIASQVKMYESDPTTRCHCSLSSSGSPERILTSQLNTWNLINTTDEVVLSPRVRSPPRLWAARRRPHTASFRKQDKRVSAGNQRPQQSGIFPCRYRFTWAWESLCTEASPRGWWQPQTWGLLCCWCRRSFHLASSWLAAAGEQRRSVNKRDFTQKSANNNDSTGSDTLSAQTLSQPAGRMTRVIMLIQKMKVNRNWGHHELTSQTHLDIYNLQVSSLIQGDFV